MYMLFKTMFVYFSLYYITIYGYFIFYKLNKFIFLLKKYSITYHYFYIFIYLWLLWLLNINILFFIIIGSGINFINNEIISINIKGIVGTFVLLTLLMYFNINMVNFDKLIVLYFIEILSFLVYIYIYIIIFYFLNKYINKYYFIIFYYFLNNFIFSIIFILIVGNLLNMFGNFITNINIYLFFNFLNYDLISFLILFKFGTNLILIYKIDLYKELPFNGIFIYTSLNLWLFLILLFFIYPYLHYNLIFNYYKILIPFSSIFIILYARNLNNISYFFNISTLLTLNFLVLIIDCFDILNFPKIKKK